MVVTPNCVVAVSVAASRLLPGAPVVSSSTYDALPVCVKGVLEGEGVWEGVRVTLGVTEGVPVGLRVTEGVPVGLGELLGEPLGVVVTVREGVAEAVFVGDCEGNAPREKEGVGEGVGVNEKSSTPCTYTAVP